MASTLSEFLDSQDELVREAALALPHQFSQCTYPLGPLRQAVYLCLTCPEARGLCSACSVSSHTDHEQIELFPKRNFRCDCPTSAIAHPCTLHAKPEDENTTNQYGQNFEGLFCRCGRPYDAKTERETMIQCLACEDWFHESCCNLRERPDSRETSPISASATDAQSSPPEEPESQAAEDSVSDASSSGLPPPLISGDEYESLVCSSCVLRNPTLRRWMGTSGAIIVGRDSPEHPWRRVNGPASEVEEVIQIDRLGDTEEAKATIKRPLSPSVLDGPEAKRPKANSCSTVESTASVSVSELPDPCLAPPQHPLAQTVLSALTESDVNTSLGAGDIFFTLGFRERWCHCASCRPSLNGNPYLLQDEELYEPPEDPDSGLKDRLNIGGTLLNDVQYLPDLGLSLEELGMRALQRIPRERAIDGIHAFNAMRDDLVKFLRPFAQDGKVVNESDVKTFFASLNEAANDKKSHH